MCPEKTKTLASSSYVLLQTSSSTRCFANTRHVIVKTVGIDTALSRQQLRGWGGWDLSRDTLLTWGSPGHPVSHVTSHCTPEGTSDNFYDRVSKLIC